MTLTYYLSIPRICIPSFSITFYQPSCTALILCFLFLFWLHPAEVHGHRCYYYSFLFSSSALFSSCARPARQPCQIEFLSMEDCGCGGVELHVRMEEGRCLPPHGQQFWWMRERSGEIEELFFSSVFVVFGEAKMGVRKGGGTTCWGIYLCAAGAKRTDEGTNGGVSRVSQEALL